MSLKKYIKRIKISPFTLFFSCVFFVWDFSLYTLLTVAAAAIHELGHLAAMRFCGVRFESITLHPFGADIRRSRGMTSYKTDITVSLGGIAANLLAAVFLLPLSGNSYIFFLIICNIALAFLNALPIKTLDGGEALEALLLLALPALSAARITRTVSFIFILVLWCAAVCGLMLTNGNLSLFLICVYLFGTIFLKEDSNGTI